MNIKQNLVTGKNRPGEKLKEVQHIIIHWIGEYNHTVKQVVSWWNSGQEYGSAHYIIDTKGEIFSTIPEDEIAYHNGHFTKNDYYTLFINSKGLQNYYSIGIEMIPIFKNNRWTFSDETYKSAIELVRDLLKKYNLLPKDVIRHYDVNGKNCPAPFIDNNAWLEFKNFLA
jgi:N-acetylmuramoyl-L-alanine amidase CwlA